MKKRTIADAINELCLSRGKMAFVYGPRQCGKTTLGKMLLKKQGAGSYYNWDDIEFRRLWAKDPKRVIPGTGRNPLIVLDEIHKAKSWKRSIKGIYDTLEKPVNFFVTGSARLTVYRKGSDSLLGRYLPFRLHPFTLGELTRTRLKGPDEVMELLFSGATRNSVSSTRTMKDLLVYGAFPEPFLAQNEKIARLWRQNRMERVIREDLRDLSRIPELSRIEMLAALLPERVGAPLSLNSLREDLEVSYDTVKRWLGHLSELYYTFLIRPYHKKVTRSLKKEAKLYLWDYSEVSDPGARFENFIACHLLKACHFWTDTGEGNFELFYLRNKQKEEIDFLICRDGTPWLPVEVKSGETQPSNHWKKFMPAIGCKHGLQVINKTGHRKSWKTGDFEILVMGAAEALSNFP